MEPLAAQFQEAVLTGCDEAWQACRYNPTYFRRMVLEQGAVSAVQRLLTGDDFHEGLTRLWECKRLDLSVEAWVLRAEWTPLFSDAERAVARRRLTQLGYSHETPAGPDA